MAIHGVFTHNPVPLKPKLKRICHGITIVDGQIQHQHLCDYVVSTGPDSFCIEFDKGKTNYIKGICLFLTDYESKAEKRPIDSEARALVLGDFEDEILTEEKMDLYKAIHMIEEISVGIQSSNSSFSSKLPVFAWETHWANVIARRQMPFNVGAELQSLDMLPIRIGWVCPAINEKVPVGDLEFKFGCIEKSTIPISAQFHIDMATYE